MRKPKKEGPITLSEMFTRAGHLTETGAVVAMDAESSGGFPENKVVRHLLSCKKCRGRVRKVHETMDFVRKVFSWDLGRSKR